MTNIRNQAKEAKVIAVNLAAHSKLYFALGVCIELLDSVINSLNKYKFKPLPFPRLKHNRINKKSFKSIHLNLYKPYCE